MNSEVQYSTRSIFALVTSVAVLCGTYSWLLSESGFHTFDDVPPLFAPSIDFMVLGIALVPFFCLPMLIAVCVLSLWTSPRPVTLLVFAGIQFSVFAVDISFLGHGMRVVFAMLISAIALNVEIYWRRLSTGKRYAGVGALLLPVAWYIAILCICASANV